MTDQNNEKVQFLLAAIRTAKWQYDLATWGSGGLMVLFYRPGKTISAGLSILAEWDDLGPTEKLDLAQRAVAQEEERLRGSDFDPTQPKPAA